MNTQPTFIELPSEPMQEIYHTVQRFAESDIPSIIMGETGVGKEGVAQYIHKSGPRRDKPFVAINCGRFSTELLQSELFGHEEGAFTGASRQRKGAFEKVNGGILFLDELAEMPLTAQAMLLRVVDTKAFTRLGGNEEVKVDFQLVAATNRDIGRAVLNEEFRPDLYYRLAGVVLHVPPLRERREDIVPLVNAFIKEFSPKRGNDTPSITQAALTWLEQATWPGNIRQLRSTVRTATALAATDTLDIEHFPYNFFPLPGLEESISAPPTKGDISAYPEFVQTLLSICRKFPAEIQQTLISELSIHIPSFNHSVQDSNIGTTDESPELLNIKDMDQNQILCAVAQKRIAAHDSLGRAAHSLGIDTRTLKRYAQWEK